MHRDLHAKIVIVRHRKRFAVDQRQSFSLLLLPAQRAKIDHLRFCRKGNAALRQGFLIIKLRIFARLVEGCQVTRLAEIHLVNQVAHPVVFIASLLNQQDVLIIERHDVADFGIAVFVVGRAVDRVTVHRSFAGRRVEAHQTGKQRLLFALPVDVQRALHGGDNPPVRHPGQAFKAPVGLAPFDDVWQTARDRFFPFRGLRPVDREDLAFAVDVNQERAVLVAQPVAAFAVRRDAFRIQSAVITFQDLEGVAERHFIGGANHAALQRQTVNLAFIVMQRAGINRLRFAVLDADGHQERREIRRNKDFGFVFTHFWRIGVGTAIGHGRKRQGIALLARKQQARTNPHREPVRERIGKRAAVFHMGAVREADDIALSGRLRSQARERERTTDKHRNNFSFHIVSVQ